MNTGGNYSQEFLGFSSTDIRYIERFCCLERFLLSMILFLGVERRGNWVCSQEKGVFGVQQASLHGALSTWVLQRAVIALKISIMKMLM